MLEHKHKGTNEHPKLSVYRETIKGHSPLVGILICSSAMCESSLRVWANSIKIVLVTWQVSLRHALKDYKKVREEEMFDMIQSGCTISDGNDYNMLN